MVDAVELREERGERGTVRGVHGPPARMAAQFRRGRDETGRGTPTEDDVGARRDRLVSDT
ncbi:hypothetical protein Stube_65960 [Streptomyces tubercidicus]|uniref:Uncharacterized protein n=1 Tax=Streptomyces tubercidicus TaxID=47759 RepID=A0A640V0L4_9ACTN|nr:hypothetical protein Stube_65960 [Streptomyces tubercidicus]